MNLHYLLKLLKNNEEKLPPTKVLLQVGLDIETSAMCYYLLRFRLTNKTKQKFLTSSTKQNQAAAPG